MNTIQNKAHQLGFYFLCMLGFFLPLWILATDFFVFLTAMCWLLSGNLKEKFNAIASRPVFLALIAYVALYGIGLLWSNDLHNGLELFSKEAILLMAPVIATYGLSDRQLKILPVGFLASLFLSVLLSFLLTLGIITYPHVRTDYNLPFNGHIHFSVFLAISAIFFIVYREQLRSVRISPLISIVIAVLLVLDLLLTNGRSGQLVFFIAMMIYISYLYRNNLKKALMGVGAILVLVVGIYFVVPAFKERVDLAVTQITTFDEKPNTSVGKRMAFTINTLYMIAEKPFTGHGTGSFPKRYEELSPIHTPGVDGTTHPHNNYLFVMSELGLAGLLTLLLIFIFAIRDTLREFRADSINGIFRILVLLAYILILFSDDYFRGHDSALFFALFLGMTYAPMLRNEKTEDADIVTNAILFK